MLRFIYNNSCKPGATDFKFLHWLFPECPAGWTYAVGSCYYWEITTYNTYPAWESYCQTLNGHLTYIETAEELSAVLQLMGT
jgi:hypothetical protein